MENIIKAKVKKEKIAFYINPEEKEAIEKIAEELDTSLSNVIGSVVSNYLESVE